jgi:hypothetical protein
MREANDLGYECLLLADCTGATDHNNHLAALHMVKMQGGVFGSVSDSSSVLAALAATASMAEQASEVTLVQEPQNELEQETEKESV